METSEERELIEALRHEEYIALGKKEISETTVRDIEEETPWKETKETEFETLVEEVTHVEMPDISTETRVRPVVEEVEEKPQPELERTTVELEHRTAPKDESVTAEIVPAILPVTPKANVETVVAERQHLGVISVTRFEPEFIASVVASSADVVHEGKQAHFC